MIGTILIVDGVATNRIVMKVKLAGAGYRTLAAGDVASCFDLARREKPDLILLDIDVPDIGGIELLRALRTDPTTSRILVVMVSSLHNRDQRLDALRAGADEFLAKPIDDHTLLARLRSLTRARDDLDGMDTRGDGIANFSIAEPPAPFQRPGQIVIVTARPDTAIRLRHSLASFSKDQFKCLSFDQVFNQQTTEAVGPDVYLIEVSAQDGDRGLIVMSTLRSRQETRHTKICILNAAESPDLPAMAFDLGAHDLVAADLDLEEIALRLSVLVRRKSEADRQRANLRDNLRLAMMDPLTGIPNRRSGMTQLGLIADRTLAQSSHFALLVLDLDKFKSVNDRFGHAAGDAVLVEVARRLKECLRSTDMIARIGGEEFLICLPDTTLSESRLVAERLCHEIESAPIRLHTGEHLQVTISIGLALSNDGHDMDAAPLVNETFDRADMALLAAKRAGRNQVTISRTAAA